MAKAAKAQQPRVKARLQASRSAVCAPTRSTVATASSRVARRHSDARSMLRSRGRAARTSGRSTRHRARRRTRVTTAPRRS